MIREHAAEAEEKRRLSRPVVEAMLQAGLYSMSRPKAFGGLEVDPLTMFRVVEEVARHDSAAGWNLQLSVAANCFLAWLPDEGAAEIMHSHSQYHHCDIVHSRSTGDPCGWRLSSVRAVALRQRRP